MAVLPLQGRCMSAANPPPKIACPHCQALIKSPALPAGSQVNCPKCGRGFRLGEVRGGAQTPDSGVRSQESGARSQAAASTRPQVAVQRPQSARAPAAPAASRPPRKLDISVDPKVAPLNPGNAAQTRPLAPLPPLEDDGFVSLDSPGSEPARPAKPVTGQEPAGKRPPPVPPEVSQAALRAAAGVVPLPPAPRTEPV